MNDPTSPFYHEWPNPNDRERYALHAREAYLQIKEDRRAAFEGHVGYGKWLIASVLAVHFAAIYCIVTIAPQTQGEVRVQLISSVAFNVFGIVAILLAGFFAWMNFQFAERLHADWSNPAMLYRNDQWPTYQPAMATRINATVLIAAGCGIASVIVFIMGAAEAMNALM